MKKLKKGLALSAYKNSPFIRQRMNIFYKSMNCNIEEQKLRVNDSNVVGENQKFNIVLKSLGRKKKMSMAMLFNC